METTNLVIGSLFAGRYRIVRRIAAGGMGAVYEVIHVETERRRALKIMHAHLFQSHELRERFKREAKVAAHVDCEFIVDVFDAGIDETTGIPFLVMEFLRGEELGERLLRERGFVPAEVLTYLYQVALALDKTHEAAIVHRDLKPANVFLTERSDGGVRVKILDFGIAKIVAEGATTGGATQSLGTPLYMAPEQFNPSMRLTGAADIFALGMMTYTLLVGAPYWADEARAGNVYALIAVAIHGPGEHASVRAARRGVVLPPDFDAWFARMTATTPAQRFPTATEAIRALADVFRLPLAPRAPMLSISGNFEHPSSMGPAFPPPTALLAARTPTPSKTMEASFGSVPEATMSGASTTAHAPTKRARSLRFLVAGVMIAMVAAGALVATILLQPKAPNPQQVAATPSSSTSVSAPLIEIAKPETSVVAIASVSAKPDVGPIPSATASAVVSSAPRQTIPSPKRPRSESIHQW